MEHEDLTKARYYSERLAHFATAVFWRAPSKDFLEEQMHDAFAEVAAALGYEIKRKEPAE